MTRKLVLLSILLLSDWGAAFAAGTRYDIRVDGLACPFCAYGIEKKFLNINGVDSVDIDIVKGLVIVSTGSSRIFTEQDLKDIVNNAGFTMKSFIKTDLP